MKMRKFYYAFALCAGLSFMGSSAYAQDNVVVDEEDVVVTEYNCDNNTYHFANWRNNWFIQLGAGVNQPLVEKGVGTNADIKGVDSKRFTAVYNFGVGRWISPYLGFRLNALGGALHWDNPTMMRADGSGANGWSKAKHVNLNFELMWDMFNSLGGVNDNRVFSIIPFAGFGGDFMWDVEAAGRNILRDDNETLKKNNWTLPVTAGIQLRFRLCEYVDFFAEGRMGFYGDNWNLCAYGKPVDMNLAVLGGFNINIGGRGWGQFNECGYVSQIADLNNQVNTLRAQLLDCGQALAACQAQLPCPEVVAKDCVNAPLMTTVRFTINSAKIMPTEEVNVYNMAEWMKANPNEKVTIVGYADKDTGTSEYNMALSERRANAVADALVNTYGIDRSRITVKYDGSDVQPYSTNDWNRIVIFTQK